MGAAAASIIFNLLTSVETEGHTDDCLEWRRLGINDIYCIGKHGTDWFGPEPDEEEN